MSVNFASLSYPWYRQSVSCHHNWPAGIFYNASLPLTKDYLIQILGSHEFELFSAVPYALKVLSESTKGMELLKRLKLVTFGGSPCPDTLGDMLVDKGVNLVSRYGMYV
jgi:hypothetical protein